MLFNSFQFIVFFPLICVLYYIIPRKFTKLFLVIASYLLYMNWIPAYALLLFYITIITYIGALNIQTLEKQQKKHRVIIFAILAILPLLFFKYYNFVNSNIKELLSIFHLQIDLPGLNWAIPVGISFFTFQAYGYLMEVYYKKIEPEHNLLNYILFISFFPQIASGPISKGINLLPQIKAGRTFDLTKIIEGMKLMLWGMFMKVVLADRIAIYANTVLDNYEYQNGISCFIASFCYTIQIYGDFAGYSLLAIGCGKIMGFDLPNNFNRPYFAATITDFWRRWHISLTQWLTSYVYIPLGGNRCSKARCYMNIFITFLISGLWHGANWTFIFWGWLHGMFQVIEKITGLNSTPKNKWEKIFRISLTFLIINFAWIAFRMPTISDTFAIYNKIFTNFNGTLFLPGDKTTIVFIMFALLLLLFKEITDEYFPDSFKIMNSNYTVVRWIGYVSMIVIIMLLGVFDAGQFIYVSF